MARVAEVDRGILWDEEGNWPEVLISRACSRECPVVWPLWNLWEDSAPEIHDSRISRYSVHAQSQLWQSDWLRIWNDYSAFPDADQKERGVWERECFFSKACLTSAKKLCTEGKTKTKLDTHTRLGYSANLKPRRNRNQSYHQISSPISRNFRTTSGGCPQFSKRISRNVLFHLILYRNFRKFWSNGSRPLLFSIQL